MILYVESGAGFLAPAFIIIFPGVISIYLHKRSIRPLSKPMYISVWVYTVLMALFSYGSMIYSFIDHMSKIKKGDDN